MSRSRRSIFVLAWAVTAPLGCAHILHYPVDRVKDLVDIVGVDLYCGQGVIAHAQMTKLAQLGVGSFDGEILKAHNRSFGIVEEIRSEAGLPFYYFTVYDRKALAGNENFLEKHRQLAGLGNVHYSLADPNDRGFYAVGATLVVFLGAGFELDLLQFIDFATGWLGVDIGRDDWRNRALPRVEGPRYRSAGETPISEGLEAPADA